MKKTTIVASLVLSLGLLQLTAFAKTDISGDSYGKVFGTMLINNIGAGSEGVTIDDINADVNCDNTTQSCYLEGFSWSDVIGWTFWSGNNTSGLQNELGAASFPDESIAKVTYNGNMEGFIWGENFGWIALSSCSGIDTVACAAAPHCNWSGTACEVSRSSEVADITQTQTDWGVYADFCPVKNQTACEAATATHCSWDAGDSKCLFSSGNPDGHPIKGYAWSEFLGWIKFNPEGAETSDFSGAFTSWIPDLTPPELVAVDDSWIPASSPTFIIPWDEFAKENDGPIDAIKSSITATKIGGAKYTGCDAIGINTVITHDYGSTNNINLTVDKIGQVSLPANGFCEYELSGTLYNNSGFAYYFGPEGLTQANADHGTTIGITPNIYDADAITLFVRAGEISVADSDLVSTPSNTPLVADGNDSMAISFQPKDSAGNPIIDVNADLAGSLTATENDWVRNVSMSFRFNDVAEEYYWDTILPVLSFGYSPPIKIGLGGYAASDYNLLDYPNTSGPDFDPANVNHVAGQYNFDVTGHAPTTTTSNTLSLNDIQLVLNDKVIPKISPSASTLDTSSDQKLLADASAVFLPRSLAFSPALNIESGSLDTEFLVIGTPVTATYQVGNLSTNITLDEYAMDHSMYFTGDQASTLEIKDIQHSDSKLGRTDPGVGIGTNFQVLRSLALQTQTQNEFHSQFGTYHTSHNFIPSLSADGSYLVDGEIYAAADDACRDTPGSCPQVSIDRTDSMAVAHNLAAGITAHSIEFDLVPNQLIGDGLVGSDELYDMDQFLAYKPADPSALFANNFVVYPSNLNFDPVEIKSIGLGTSGSVSGDQVFESVSGRDLDTITTTSSSDLKKEIRRSVATLTRNLDIANCNSAATISLSTTAGNCIIVDENNKTVVAIYSDDDNGVNGHEVFTLGTGSNITVPDYKYTIVLLDGAELYLNANLEYGASQTGSLGIIAIQDTNAGGSNVYIDPAPTNMVGLLYTEGSLLSSPDAGSNLYYGAGASATDLKNQLYWQGSIASRNTIGGSPNAIAPAGVDCSPWADAQSCAQAYDLDFIRRFTVINKAGQDYSPAGYLHSGGGSCSGVAPAATCTGAVSGLATTVTLSGSLIDTVNSKSLDTFFIERDNRPVPPGFSSTGGLTSSQEIR